ncbi:MAG: OBG GTPase family GTP-binding protein [Halobacteriota archaeon]
MSSTEEQIAEIENEIRETPYNKATQAHLGRLKAKIARLKERQETKGSQKGEGYAPKKAGDATCVLVGYPSVGKSTLLNALTNARSPVGAYDFTTLDVIPGAMVHNGAHIQVLDVPGLVGGAAVGRGRGKKVISVVRNADLILLVVDVFHEWQLSVLQAELYDAGIRINERSPNVTVIKKPRGGLVISRVVHSNKLDDATIKAILQDFRIHNADVIIKEDVDVDRFVDALMPSRRYIPAITVVNKIDQCTSPLQFGDIQVSAEKGIRIDALKDLIFDKLGFMRIYLKPPGRAPDMDNPLIMRRHATVGDVCNALHGDMRRRFRYAQVWGKTVRHPGQRVGAEHELTNDDVVTIIGQKRR